MQFFKNLAEQFKKFWSETAPAARVGMIATLIFSIVLIAGVGYWSSLPNYVALENNLSPESYAKIIDELSANGIRYKTSPGGSSISVEQSKLPLARSVVDQFVSTSSTYSSAGMFAGMPSPEMRKENLLREKELRLGASIAKINGINSATVHLTVSKRKFLSSNQRESKASVMLELQPNYSPSQEVIETIASLVSYVDGLKPEKVSISDIHGRKYTVNDPINRLVDDKEEYKSNLEADRKHKVEQILNNMVGFGKYSVTVTADVNVKKLDRESKKFTGEGNETSKQTVKMKNDRPNRYQGGAAGTASNQGTPPEPGQMNRAVSDGEWSDIVKVFDEVTEKEIDIVNTITQIRVAAFVEIPEPEEGSSAPSVTKEQLESLIKNAVGFVESRDDVQIEVGKLVANPLLDGMLAVDVVAPPVDNEFLMQIIRNSSLGLGALFAFAIGFLMLRKIKPVTITEPEPQISPERTKHLADLSIVAKKNPELLSRIIRSWMEDKPLEDFENESDSAAPSEERVAA